MAWSEASDDHPKGVIAGALENGSLDLWDAAKLQAGSRYRDMHVLLFLTHDF